MGQAISATNMVDTSGRAVDINAVIAGGVSYGYYLYGGDLGETNPFGNTCGPLRPGVMVLGPSPGQQVITCAGDVQENQLANVFLTDPAWKKYIAIGLQVTILGIIALIFYQLINRR